jgi:hypothetical protein
LSLNGDFNRVLAVEAQIDALIFKPQIRCFHFCPKTLFLLIRLLNSLLNHDLPTVDIGLVMLLLIWLLIIKRNENFNLLVASASDFYLERHRVSSQVNLTT